MTTLTPLFKKAWVLVAATTLIVGSSSAMVYALSPNVPANVLADVAPITTMAGASSLNPVPGAGVTANYTVVDLSKIGPERKALMKEKLSKINGITSEQIEEKYNAIAANMIPGEKDISAQQAADYAADILKKAYGVDFTGYRAEAAFSRNPVPNSDNWTVVFHAPEDTQIKNTVTIDAPEDIQNKDQYRARSKSYIASVDSVSGTMLDVSFFDPDFSNLPISHDLQDPAWVVTAKEAIFTLMPKDISIINSKVVSAIPEGGVTVVCELSNGSACSVRLVGDNKEAADYVYFPNGYDGSLDFKPFNALNGNGVG